MKPDEATASASAALMDYFGGSLSGAIVQRTRKTLGEIRALFLHGRNDPLPDETEIYTVEWTGTANNGTEGALLFGSTTLHAGSVGGEYFMTHGHIHRNQTRDELYFAVSGKGILMLMDEEGQTWAETMIPGSVHAIRGVHAHRVINTGEEDLVFWACWAADAGYDYDVIRTQGFGLRVFNRSGTPALLERGAVEDSSL